MFRPILLAMALTRASHLAAQTTPPLTPCQVPGLAGEVVCGTVSVPENRSTRAGRQINLFVVIARATGPDRRPDPFLLLAGGPGQAASRMGSFATEAFSQVRVHRDLVMIDARGTGRSNSLLCAMLRTPADLAAPTIYPPISLRICRDSLSRIADLTQYTTAAVADDIEDVRRVFGWPALNFYGTSYGSRLALTFARRHPSSVRSMVLKAVAPPAMIAPMNYAEDAQRAFDLLVRDCRAQPACVRAYPDPRADLDTVRARARRGRIRAVLPGASGDSVALAVDVITSIVMTAMQSAGGRAQLPALLHAAASGVPGPLAELITRARQTLDAEIAIGMHLSVSCGEDGRRLDIAAARRTDARTFLGSGRVRMLADACREWPAPPPTRGAHDAVVSSAPVLLVSGELDPNTPPRHADAALGTLSRGRHVVLAGVAHGWSNVTACGAAFVADFVERADARNLDVSCGERSSAPLFVVP